VERPAKVAASVLSACLYQLMDAHGAIGENRSGGEDVLVIEFFAASFQIALGCVWFALARRGTDGPRVVAVVGGAVNGLLVLAMMSPILLGQFLALLVCGGIVLALRGRTGTDFGWSAFLTVLFFAAAGFMSLATWRGLRDEFPFESVAERLSYETRHVQPVRAAPADASDASSAPELSSETRGMLERLGETEKAIPRRLRRVVSLRMVHASQVDQFISSPGFGVGRGIIPSPRYLELAKEQPPVPMPDIPQPPPSEHSSLAAPAANARIGDIAMPGGAGAQIPFPGDSNTDRLHLDALVDFVNPDGFGYVRDRDHVAGFLSHRLSRVPEIHRAAETGDPPEDTEPWLTRSVELVSLLKHDQPMVYVAKYLPNMDQLRDAAVRPLDGFEQRTLAKLRAGDDVVVETAGDRIRMLGSLRAGRQCLECHAVERGTLLGAFSYELVPDPARPIRRHDKPRVNEQLDRGVL
jgi:hypothetical protein